MGPDPAAQNEPAGQITSLVEELAGHDFPAEHDSPEQDSVDSPVLFDHLPAAQGTLVSSAVPLPGHVKPAEHGVQLDADANPSEAPKRPAGHGSCSHFSMAGTPTSVL